MTALVSAVPALAVVACLAVFVAGLRLLRADPLEGLDVGDLALLRAEQRAAVTQDRPLDRLAAPLLPLARNLAGPALRARLRRTIELAGRPGGATEDTVLLAMCRWTVILAPVVPVFLLNGQWFFVLLVPAVVLVLPLAGIARARRLRQEQLDTDLPDFLDVLAVTVSAGVAFRPALLRTSQRFGGTLADEMSLTLNQIANGAAVRQAFERLRDRNDSEALSQFVTAFVQSEELGSPLATTLNQIAEDMRRSSAQRLRQKAARIAPRVTLVTSVVLLPGAVLLMFAGFYIGSGIDLDSLTGTLR
ncbi:type II secretion system F family protein [Aquipuribacter hungaricus]|uniref:Type II secretion system F family protein n=1 Tax=Aquipuribacter hungaricus TaxID=545624 RepID=A0ABV7WKV5_9MICO